MEDLLVESGEDPTKDPQNSVIEKQSSAESVKRTSKTIKPNAAVTPKISGPARKRMEVKNSSDSSTTGVKSAATKSSSSRNSISALVTKRNSTGGLPEKQPLSITKRQTSVNSASGEKTRPVATEPLRRSLPEVRRSSFPSAATKSLSRSSISETRKLVSSVYVTRTSRTLPTSDLNRLDSGKKSYVKPSLSVSSSKRVPSASLDSTASSTTRKVVPKVSSPSPRSPSISSGSKGGSLSSLVKRSSGLSGHRKVATPESRDSRLVILPQVEIKAGDDVVSTTVNKPSRAYRQWITCPPAKLYNFVSLAQTFLLQNSFVFGPFKYLNVSKTEFN